MTMSHNVFFLFWRQGSLKHPDDFEKSVAEENLNLDFLINLLASTFPQILGLQACTTILCVYGTES